MGLQINKKLIPLKSHYFLYNAATAPVVPFIPTMARQLGFSTVIVGIIYTVLPIVGMVAKPLLGAIGDKYQRHKSLFLSFQLLTGVAFLCIMFIPPIPQSKAIEFHCNDGVSVLKHCLADGETADSCSVKELLNDKTNGTMQCQLDCQMEPWMFRDVVCKYWNIPAYCTKTATELSFSTQTKMDKIDIVGDKCLFFPIHNAKFSDGSTSTMYCPSNESVPFFKTTCEADCNNVAFAELVTVIKISNDEVVRLYQFWLFFLFLIVSWVGMAVVVSLGDAICFEMLDRPQQYGQQRMFGSIGWGTFSIIAGLLVDKFSEGQSVKNYTVVFIMTMVIIIFDMLVSARLQYSQCKRSSSILKDVGKIFKSVRISIFFLWCIVVGLGTALIWNFLFWHLEDLAAASKTCDTAWIKTLQGLAMGIQCFGGELPFFFISGWLLKKISHVHAMSLVLLGFAFRFYFYSILVNPWWVLPIELLNGVTFGIFYATMASYASIIAPSGCEATLQGLAGGVFEGVGVSLGSLIAGAMFNKIGGSQTFLWFSICAFVAFLLHASVQWLLKRTSSPDRSQYTQPIDSFHMIDDEFDDEIN